MVTVATLLVALAVWCSELTQRWVAELPAHVSVSLVFGGRVLARCDHAPLAGDPRAYAQQIAGQMLGSTTLSFWPVIEGAKPEVENWDGRWVHHHNLELQLRKLPPEAAAGEGAEVVQWNAANLWGRGSPPNLVPQQVPRRYLANAFSLSMLKGSDRYAVGVEAITLAEARELAADAVSAVGHEATCDLFSGQLGRAVPLERTAVTLCPGEELVVGQYEGARLPVGTRRLPDGARIQWFRVTLSKQAG